MERHLQNLDINTLVICGCNFPNCLRTTTYKASELDFKIVMIKYAKSLLYDRVIRVKNIGKSLIDTDECISSIDAVGDI